MRNLNISIFILTLFSLTIGDSLMANECRLSQKFGTEWGVIAIKDNKIFLEPNKNSKVIKTISFGMIIPKSESYICKRGPKSNNIWYKTKVNDGEAYFHQHFKSGLYDGNIQFMEKNKQLVLDHIEFTNDYSPDYWDSKAIKFSFYSDASYVNSRVEKIKIIFERGPLDGKEIVFTVFRKTGDRKFILSNEKSEIQFAWNANKNNLVIEVIKDGENLGFLHKISFVNKAPEP